MNKETYEALKRLMSRRYGKTSDQYKHDTKQVMSWIDEVAKEYETDKQEDRWIRDNIDMLTDDYRFDLHQFLQLDDLDTITDFDTYCKSRYDNREDEDDSGCLHNFQDNICKTCGAVSKDEPNE